MIRAGASASGIRVRGLPKPTAEPYLCQCEAARFGTNYKVGYIGFTHRIADPVAEGIAHFTRWSRMSDIRVSHCFVVTGEWECVEATVRKGVVETNLARYFQDPRTRVFFRKPRKLDAPLGKRIAATARGQAGMKYDHLLVAAQFLEGSFLRRWLRAAFRQSPDLFLGRLLNRDERWICSELAAYCLDAQPEYADRGILARPHYAIDPQELFEDQEIFAAWSQDPPAKSPPHPDAADARKVSPTAGRDPGE